MSLQEHITGIQHIGIPTNDIQKTIAFYKSLGFTVTHRTGTDAVPVAFLRLKNLTIETYQNGEAVGTSGAVDHIAIDVDDVEAAFAAVHALGYRELEEGIQFLPFWENGVKYFTIAGPNNEKVEFNQVL